MSETINYSHISINAQLRAQSAGEGRRITGRAIVFDSPSTPFVDAADLFIDEVVRRGAITRELLDRSDIVMTFNHDRSRVLARSVNGEGTLSYDVDDSGVTFAFDAPETADGNTVLSLVRRGDLSGCSFAFVPTEGGVSRTVTDVDNVRHVRYDITEVATVCDMAIVTDPRYPATEVQARSIVNRELITDNKELTMEKEESTMAKEESTMANVEARVATLEAQMRQRVTPAAEAGTRVNISEVVRRNVQKGQQTVIASLRAEGDAGAAPAAGSSLNVVADATAGGIVPLTVGDILHPLEEGVILGKLGLPMPTGLSGDYVWPMYEAVEATINGEGAELSDTKVKWDKISMKRDRIGLAIPVTRESINNTRGIVENVVRNMMPAALMRLLNKVLLSPDKVNGASGLVGPFVNAAKKNCAGAVPTLKELAGMKAAILSTGIDGTHMCWVMSQTMKAELETTPKDAGSGIMVCENDRILGVPVFCSHYVGEKNIGLGDWRYQPLGLFGDLSFVVDPYSLSRKNAVDFVINGEYGTVTLRQEAFVLGVCK